MKLSVPAIYSAPHVPKVESELLIESQRRDPGSDRFLHQGKPRAESLPEPSFGQAEAKKDNRNGSMLQ